VFWFWFLGEIVRQVSGEQPVSWCAFDQPADMNDHDTLLERAARFSSADGPLER
jgi:hypothetical protein